MMRRFIKLIISFLIVLFTLVFVFIESSEYIINKKSDFKLNTNTKYLVLGHSHSECAYNDSIIQNLQNFAQSAESYFYTYIKLKKLVQSNNQINTIFLEFSNYEIDDDWDYVYTWGNSLITSKFPKYSAITDKDDLFLILKKNFKTVISSKSISLRSNLGFAFSKKSNYPKANNWGGYLHLIRDKTDSLVLSTDYLLKFQKTDKLASTNLEYLLKIIDFCKKNKVNLYLIRSPLHPKYPGLHNETSYQNIIKTKLSKVEFLDFKNFPLQNSEFGDLNHLNHKGSKIFSVWFAQLLNTGFLEANNKQVYIDEEIKAQKHNNVYKK